MLLLATVPLRLQPLFCRCFSFLWFYLLPIRKRVVLENLMQAFPNENPAWRKKIARGSVAHFLKMMVFETIQVARQGQAAAEDLIAGSEGEEYFDASGIGNKACIMLGGHFGSWEIPLVNLSAKRGIQMASIGKPMHNPLVEKIIINSRKRWNCMNISTRENPTRGIITAFREKRGLAILADQDARRNGIFVPFFGKMAATPDGPATLAYRFKVPILMLFCLRRPSDGRYIMHWEKPLIANPDAPRKEEIKRLTTLHVATLEKWIRKYPDQYFWFHKRWKTQPKPQKESPESCSA